MTEKAFDITYPGFCRKAVTFSYDDGTFYDVFLVKLLDKYGLKSTFNINTGLFGATCSLEFCGKTIFHNRLSREQTAVLYKGHELASHSRTHPLLIGQPSGFLDREVLDDLKELDAVTGEKTVGFAYPGGPHDEFTDSYLSDKVLYARTIESTRSFDVPKSFIPLHPTVFHMDEDFVRLCEDYVKLVPHDITWLYVWGHSYEMEIDGVRENLERVFALLSSQKDIWFATNRELINYVKCARELKYENGSFVNATGVTVFAEKDGVRYSVP